MPAAVVSLAAGRLDRRDEARVVGFADRPAVGVAGLRSQNADPLALFATSSYENSQSDSE